MSRTYYPVEKGVPIPAAGKPFRVRRRGNRRYPWHLMEPGDSFFVPCKKEEARLIQSGMHSGAKGARLTVTTRKLPGGIRCWRLPEETSND
jgi:hypothetical protein